MFWNWKDMNYTIKKKEKCIVLFKLYQEVSVKFPIDSITGEIHYREFI